MQKDTLKKAKRVYIPPKNFLKITNNPLPFFMKKLKENEGFIDIGLALTHAYITNRPNIIRHVLQKNNKNYRKTDVVREVLAKDVGKGLLTSEGDYWLQQRRAIQPGFHRKRLEAISKIMIKEIRSFLDEEFDKYADTEEVIDISKEMMHLAFKIVSKALFSNGPKEEDLELIDKTVSSAQEYIVMTLRRPYLKPWYWLNGRSAEHEALKNASDKVIFDAIDERIETKERHDDLLDMLLETRYEETGEGMSRQQIKDEALILYVAGHETTALAMTWMWYLLSTHKDIEDKLLQSVEEVLGKDNPPSFADTRNLTYAMQVIEETMRLYPPAWMIDRHSLEEDEVDGFVIEKDKDILLSIYGVHHHPDYWEEPEKFDPERFTPENKKKQEPYTYLPFGGGPRLCIGNNFALMEMQFILAEMVRRYRFELVPNQKIEMNPLITLRPRYGLKVKVKRR